MEWPHALSSWLMAQGVDPERVSVVLQVGRADDAERIEAGFKRELAREFIARDTLNTQVVKYCGLAIEVRALRELA